MTISFPELRQSTSRSHCRYETKSTTLTFDDPTKEKNLIVVTVVLSGGDPTTVTMPSGFVLVRDRSIGHLQVQMWYYQGAPSMTSVRVSWHHDRSASVRVFEYSHAAQTNALDKVSVLTNQHDAPDSGSCGDTAQDDEIVIAVVANRYASTTQSGHTGGLVRLYEGCSPQYYGRYGSNDDDDRHRCSHHHSIQHSHWNWRHSCHLSSRRDWIAIIATFRGGTYGPKQLASTVAPTMLTANGLAGAAARLNAFGAFKSTIAPPMVVTTSVNGSAIMLPYNYQFRLNGLLVGQDTWYDVESHDGLYGYAVRTSDDDQPRGDGALRGVDLQSARQILFKLSVGGSGEVVEQLLGVLYAALTPRRDTDWELVWRHPTQGARVLRCRPVELPREVTDISTMVAQQAVTLLAADPRHYSATLHEVIVPNDGSLVTANNAGDLPAYPVITVTGPTSGPAISRVALTNMSALVSWDVALTVPSRAVLIGDMEARATGVPRSLITLDGQSKYGSWQLPRTPFRIDPAPYAPDGDNELRLTTEPPGAPVTCRLTYRDTWAG